MPFTPSHVAAALPLLRTPLLPAAVVVGTVTPDIPYYVPLFVPRAVSHSIFGAVTIDLAMALVSVLLWWLFLREPVIDLLPRGIGQRIPPAARLGWRPTRWGWPLTAVVLVASVEAGIATHLLWDSFTHPGWVVDHLTVLRTQLGRFHWRSGCSTRARYSGSWFSRSGVRSGGDARTPTPSEPLGSTVDVECSARRRL